MATAVTRAPLGVWARAKSIALSRYGVVFGLAVLVLFSLYLRSKELNVGYWIDEGLSVGIASHHFADIPGVLRQDGSPPLYYMALHLWINLFDDSEKATHQLSLFFALCTIPAGYWAGSSLFGKRAGWTCALLAALNPFLTAYGQETRMYSAVALFALISTAGFVHVIVHGRRKYLPVFIFGTVAAMYTHNWALFMGAGMGAVWIALLILDEERRSERLKSGLWGFGAILALYAPWVPTLMFQAAHTGAPWSTKPGVQAIIDSPERLLGGEGPEMLLLLCAGTGGWLLLSNKKAPAREREAVICLIALFVLTIGIAWTQSQISPAWAFRYFAVGLGPLLLLLALGLAANRTRTGIVGLALVCVFWVSYDAPASKSNVRAVMGDVGHLMRPGDLVISTQPEQVSVIQHYLPKGLQYATLTGKVKDTGVTDWRDGVDKLQATSVQKDLAPLLDALPKGRRVLVVSPMILDERRWQAPWTALVRERSLRWRAAIAGDPRFTVTALSPGSLYPVQPYPVRASLYEKTGAR